MSPEIDYPELPDAPVERVRAILEVILDWFDHDGEIEIRESDEEIKVSIEGDDDLGLLIGRHGQTIEAIQFICYRAAFQHSDQRKRVIVDAAGYRERRVEILEREAEAAVRRALDGGRPVPLSPMNSTERRVVHQYLKEQAGIETYSEGDEPDRRVVVAPLLPD